MDTITKYRCGECGTIWEDKWDADDCCNPDSEEVTIYICEDCGQEFETEKEAFDCCQQTVLNIPESAVSTENLEEKKQ